MEKLRREDQSVTEEPGSSMMMVRVKKGEQKPDGARFMTTEEVLTMQNKIITKWQPHSEMWPFSWGIGILGAASALSGIYVNSVCRQRLGLMTMARLATYAPTVAVPVIISGLFHSLIITNKVLVGEFPCTVCAAMRSGSVQSLAGGLYPIVLGPLVCVAIARKYHTYYVPTTLQERAQVLPFLRRIMPGPGALLAILLANFAVGMAISDRETMLFAKYLSPSATSLRKSDEEEYFQ